MLAAIFHCVYFFGMFYLFPRVPLWIMLVLGFVYSVSISWNINGISHNFIHNPYFRSPLLNRLFSTFESITVGFSQIFYECIHMQHHRGNADRPNENGETVDWISIYKHGHDGEPEHPLKYTFLSFFREDPKTSERSQIKVDLPAVMSGKQADIVLMANDMVIVPNSRMKTIGGTMLSAFGVGLARVPAF